MVTLTGSRTIWGYLWEDDGSYAQDPGDPSDTDVKAFGDSETVTPPQLSNQSSPLYRPFSRQPTKYLEGGFNGSWGTDFVYTNPWWLCFVYGEPTETDNGDGTFTLVFDNDPERPPRTAHLISETHYEDGTVSQTVYIGAAVDSPSFSAAVNDTVNVSLSGFFADQKTYQDVADSPIPELESQPDTQFRPLHFGNAELYLDLDQDNTPEFKGLVQNADVSFNTTVNPEYELGTRFAVQKTDLQFEPSLTYSARITTAVRDQERFNFYGDQSNVSSGDPNLPQEEMNGADILGKMEAFSRFEDNRLILDFEEAFPEQYQQAGFADPASAIDANVSRNLTSLKATATVGVTPKI